MKVIIIKNYQKYKVDQIVDVIDGYAKNFLIPEGYAVPFTNSNKKQMDCKIKEKNESEKAQFIEDLKLKEKIEQLIFNFELKCVNDKIIGSITTKAIHQKIVDYGIKIPKHSLESVQIRTIGKTIIPMKISKKVIANLEINIRKV